MRRRLSAALVLLALIAAVPAAQAQPRLYAGVGIIADNDRTNSRLTETIAASWTIVGGIDVTPRMGLRVMIDAAREASETSEGTYQSREDPLPVHQRLTRTRRSMTYGVLGDVHGQLASRVRLAFTFGLATVTHDEETRIVREEIRTDGTAAGLPDFRSTGKFPWRTAPVGIEVPILIGRALEVVPEFRLFYFLGSDSPKPYILRTGGECAGGSDAGGTIPRPMARLYRASLCG